MNTRALAAEFVGTCILISAGMGAGFHSFGGEGISGAAGILGVAFAAGITLAALLYSFAHISGGHFNPAVTVGLAAGGRFEWRNVGPYVIAQCLGAAVAVAIFAFVGHTGLNFAANGYGDQSMLKVGLAGVFLLETVLMAFFMIIIMGATRNGLNGFAAIAIGLTLTVLIIMTLPVDNAGFNPARSFGSAIHAGGTAMTQQWLFWVAPMLGAAIGALFYNWIASESDARTAARSEPSAA